MKRLVALAGLTAPLLVVTPSAFAATGVGVITTSTTSTSTGSLSTSAVTGTVSTVTQPVSTTNTAAPTTSTTSTPTSSTSPTTLSGLLSPTTTTSSSSSSTTSTPAPPGTSEAYAAEVAGVVAISHTKATADGNPNDSSATADPLELGGTPAVGGTVSGKSGESNGTLFGPGDPTSSANPLEPLGLEVMPYDAKVTNSSTGQTSHADASLLTLLLPDSGGPTVYADVLHSESNATYTYGTNGNPDTSTGDTTSYGAHINLGGTSPSDTCASNNCLDIYLLYSHTDSSGQGNNAYLASINGNQIVNASQVGNQCNIPLNPLIDIVCVYATGGTGTTGSSTSKTVTQSAGVLTGTSQSGLPTVNLFTGQSTPAKNGALSGGSNNGGSNNGNNQTSGSGNGNGGNGGNGGGSTPSVVTSGLQSGAAASTLPFTGFNAGLVALLGAFLAMVGVALRRSGAISRPRA